MIKKLKCTFLGTLPSTSLTVFCKVYKQLLTPTPLVLNSYKARTVKKCEIVQYICEKIFQIDPKILTTLLLFCDSSNLKRPFNVNFMLFYKLVEASLTNMSFTYQRENKTKRWHVNTLVKQQYLFDLHCRDELNVNLLFTDSTSTLSDNWNKCNVLSTSTESYCGQIETLTQKN